MSYIEIGKTEGRLVAGGGRPDGFPTGNFVAPTVFADVAPDARIFQEEIFGPVVAITPFDTDEEALALANGVEVRPRRLRLDERPQARAQLRAGDRGRAWCGSTRTTCATCAPRSAGVKASGLGHEGGYRSIDFYTDQQAVHITLGEAHNPTFGKAPSRIRTARPTSTTPTRADPSHASLVARSSLTDRWTLDENLRTSSAQARRNAPNPRIRTGRRPATASPPRRPGPRHPALRVHGDRRDRPRGIPQLLRRRARPRSSRRRTRTPSTCARSRSSSTTTSCCARARSPPSPRSPTGCAARRTSTRRSRSTRNSDAASSAAPRASPRASATRCASRTRSASPTSSSTTSSTSSASPGATTSTRRARSCASTTSTR